VEGVLLVPLRFQDPLVLQVHRKTYELVLAHSGIRFPKTFKWGVATSGYQIEGGNVESDWYQFEEKPGSIFRNHRSDQGPDHWNRVRSDVALLKKLGVQQYRMSIEWSRIQPKENEWDLKAVQHYRDEIQLLLQHQIEPIVTLWHSTLPLWVSEKGGWEWEGIAPAFAQFSSFVYQKLLPK